jgi:hypothetical protein
MWRQYSNNVAQLSVGQRLDRGRGRAANVPRDRPDDIGDRLPQTNKQTDTQTTRRDHRRSAQRKQASKRRNRQGGGSALRSIDACDFFIVSNSTAADGPKFRDAKRESCSAFATVTARLSRIPCLRG